MSNLQQVIGDYKNFLERALSNVKRERFDFSDFIQLDVICYRTASQSNYEQKKEELGNIGALLSEVIVSGRPIATYQLDEPIYFQDWRIDTIELPAPKEGSEKPEGLEHIQFVIYNDLQTFIQKYPDKNFDTRAIERGVNPMIAYKFNDGTVKFHRLNLATAIYLEEKLNLSEIK